MRLGEIQGFIKLYSFCQGSYNKLLYSLVSVYYGLLLYRFVKGGN
ncbi:hypothetical protein HNQ88_001614 [Aureibacter tunicatorum]|uniref:Uncharacterized protein n=1 Tax=Aureibacter tunicatorum TaxID=866807 RepID=A0AAE3XKJ2_9BACT|nr:hypothetical protein [Aureibacter tunicatorum]BDD05492.1 hypothetical protein AUTU_29750 [Aureibacter tunicatorum]